MTDLIGYLVRIAPNEVSCSDPDAIKVYCYCRVDPCLQISNF